MVLNAVITGSDGQLYSLPPASVATPEPPTAGLFILTMVSMVYFRKVFQPRTESGNKEVTLEFPSSV